MKQSELAKSLKLFIGLTCIILAICAFVFIPKAGKDMALESPEYSYLYYPFLVFIWITIIPIYAALFECWKISNEKNKDNSFSALNLLRIFFSNIMIAWVLAIEKILFLLSV